MWPPWLTQMAHFHQQRWARIQIPNPIITLYYAQLFPLVRIQIRIPVRIVSQMVTVPILGMDLRPRNPNPNPSPLVEMSHNNDYATSKLNVFKWFTSARPTFKWIRHFHENLHIYFSQFLLIFGQPCFSFKYAALHLLYFVLQLFDIFLILFILYQLLVQLFLNFRYILQSAITKIVILLSITLCKIKPTVYTLNSYEVR